MTEGGSETFGESVSSAEDVEDADEVNSDEALALNETVGDSVAVGETVGVRVGSALALGSFVAELDANAEDENVGDGLNEADTDADRPNEDVPAAVDDKVVIALNDVVDSTVDVGDAIVLTVADSECATEIVIVTVPVETSDTNEDIDAVATALIDAE